MPHRHQNPSARFKRTLKHKTRAITESTGIRPVKTKVPGADLVGEVGGEVGVVAVVLEAGEADVAVLEEDQVRHGAERSACRRGCQTSALPAAEG